jgi:hypothetical protein
MATEYVLRPLPVMAAQVVKRTVKETDIRYFGPTYAYELDDGRVITRRDFCAHEIGSYYVEPQEDRPWFCTQDEFEAAYYRGEEKK